MDERDLLEALVELAAETGLAVQRVSRQPVFEGLSPSSSGTCRVKGELRVLLSDSDPPAARIGVLARALARERGERLAGRYLAPALRECLDRAAEDAAAGT
ncbi:MAG: hypothetical protein ACQGVC_07960 [Myxococcota bacterium]